MNAKQLISRKGSARLCQKMSRVWRNMFNTALPTANNRAARAGQGE
jgi:hypothetical protein